MAQSINAQPVKVLYYWKGLHQIEVENVFLLQLICAFSIPFPSPPPYSSEHHYEQELPFTSETVIIRRIIFNRAFLRVYCIQEILHFPVDL